MLAHKNLPFKRSQFGDDCPHFGYVQSDIRPAMTLMLIIAFISGEPNLFAVRFMNSLECEQAKNEVVQQLKAAKVEKYGLACVTPATIEES